MGPGDPWSRELPRAIKSGQFAFINRGEYPFASCHANNVIEAILCALEHGAGGHAYFINDREKITFREFIKNIASLQNLSIERLRSMPYGLAFAMARVMEFFAAITFRKSDPQLSRSMVCMIGREFRRNDAAARRELG